MKMRVFVNWKPLDKTFRRMESKTPALARKAMVKAVTWWKETAKPRVPVSAGGKGKRPRGQLKKRTISYVKRGTSGLEGGIIVGTHYSPYLVYGTKYIAGGAVKRWQLGDQPIRTWPAKRAGGNPRGLLPVALIWWQEARDRLQSELEKSVGFE